MQLGYVVCKADGVQDVKRDEWEKGVSNKIRLFETFRLYRLGELLKAYDAAMQLQRESPSYGSGEYFYRRLSAERVCYLSVSVAADIQEGLHLASNGQFSVAVKCFEKVLKRWPDSPQVNLYYAACMLGLGDLEKAEDYAKRAVELDPNGKDQRDLLTLIRSKRSLTGN